MQEGTSGRILRWSLRRTRCERVGWREEVEIGEVRDGGGGTKEYSDQKDVESMGPRYDETASLCNVRD